MRKVTEYIGNDRNTGKHPDNKKIMKVCDEVKGLFCNCTKEVVVGDHWDDRDDLGTFYLVTPSGNVFCVE